MALASAGARADGSTFSLPSALQDASSLVFAQMTSNAAVRLPQTTTGCISID